MTRTGSGADARPAAVADVRLDHDRVELGTDDGAVGHTSRHPAWTQLCRRRSSSASGRRMGLETGSMKRTCRQWCRPACGCCRSCSPLSSPIPPFRRGVVPFLARDLARFAADANRGVGEESHGLRHITPFPRCRRTPCLRGIRTFGSPTTDVRSLTTSPVLSPSSPVPGHAHVVDRFAGDGITPMRWVTSAFARIWPAGLDTITQSRFLSPFPWPGCARAR